MLAGTDTRHDAEISEGEGETATTSEDGSAAVYENRR